MAKSVTCIQSKRSLIIVGVQGILHPEVQSCDKTVFADSCRAVAKALENVQVSSGANLKRLTTVETASIRR